MMILGVSIVYLSAFLIGVESGCSRMDACNLDFQKGLEIAGIEAPESSAAYCTELRAYAQCIKKSTKACRGDLNFHSSSSLIYTLMSRYKCSQIPNYKRPSSHSQRQNNQCTYQSNSNYKHCGIFGDPHLKTFSRTYQTCSTKGAWPLIDNKYLAVQVTNMPIVNSTAATGTTKVTIIIRGYTACAEEKTYEATADSPLKPYFIDGTQVAGPEGTIKLKLTASEGSEKVEIHLSYIDTTLVIRRVGEYLGFSCRLPEEISKSREDNALELCRTGCPTTELLDIASSRGHYLSWQAAYASCKEKSNLNDDIKNTLTDYYLDWCIFDIMMTGKEDFVSAAHSAQADVLQFDPNSLHNRTEPLQLNQMPFSSGGPSMKISLILLVALFLIYCCKL